MGRAPRTVRRGSTRADMCGFTTRQRTKTTLFSLVREDDVVWNVAGTYMWCVPDPRRSVPTPKHIKRVRILRLPPPGSLVGHPYSPHHRYACTRPVTVWPVRSPGTEVVTLNIECTPHGTDFFSGTEGRAMQPTAGAASWSETGHPAPRTALRSTVKIRRASLEKNCDRVS